jgi:glycosyltransferase involved in cell wall biosynthesis
MNKICHISTVHRWNDIRIFKKQCVSLAASGYEVHLIIQAEKDQTVDGVHIHALRTPINRSDRAFKLSAAAYRLARSIDADVYHLHDPELLPMGVILRRSNSVVVYDSHENTPASILDKKWIPISSIRWLLSGAFKWFEAACVSKLNGVISVAEPLTGRFKHKHRLTLSNLPILESFKCQELPPPLSSAQGGPVYAGGLSSIRNIHIMIEANARISGSTLHLFGPWESQAYEQFCMNLPGWSNTHYWGHLPIEHVYSFMQSKGSCGLILFDPHIKNHQIAVPNKAFEYMAAGIPLVISDIPFWKNTFEDLAIFVEPESATSVADAIVQLSQDNSLAQRLGDAGKTYVEQNNWSSEYPKLIRFYELLTKSTS